MMVGVFYVLRLDVLLLEIDCLFLVICIAIYLYIKGMLYLWVFKGLFREYYYPYVEIGKLGVMSR